MKGRIVIFFILLLYFNVNGQSKAIRNKVLTGKVIAITDGDTFKLLLQDSIQIKVRLANIDCPERKQPFSARAKQYASDAIFGKRITIHVLKKDRYGRSIANVIYNGSLNLSHELVKHGLAWHYVKYSNDNELQSMEDDARKDKLGLWQDPNAIPPWIWRSNKKIRNKTK